MVLRKTFLATGGLALSLVIAGAVAFLIAATSGSDVSSKNIPDPDSSGVETVNLTGVWTLEVRETDGTLVERRQFHNALTDRGKDRLARMLSDGTMAGAWAINLNAPVGETGPCNQFSDDRNNNDRPCSMVEGNVPGFNGHVFPTLAKVRTFGSPKTTFVGHVQIANKAHIHSVSTSVGECPAVPTLFTLCANHDYQFISTKTWMPFTEAVLDQDISVEVGQVVSVTVELGF